tara:strand:+ start:1028 stop:1228 length:201 start_codon:yes stop_codon:yes gene_type:complete
VTNIRLSPDQQDKLNAIFAQVDEIDDIDQLRMVTKNLMIAQENEKAFAREAVIQIQQELNRVASHS